MSIKNAALACIRAGFQVMPCVPNGKSPKLEGWKDAATRNPAMVNTWWDNSPNFNIGLPMGSYAGIYFILAVDIDNKTDERKGDKSVEDLAKQGKDLPLTLTTLTPSGGKHLFYKTSRKFGNRVAMYPGIDIRGEGGFVVGPGSVVDGKTYRTEVAPIADCPEWLERELTAHETPPRKALTTFEDDTDPVVVDTATRYLTQSAPVAVEGDAGDQTTFQVAAHLKDYGVSQDAALNLMLDHWNDRCDPPWPEDELARKVKNAYSYGKNTKGIDYLQFDEGDLYVDERTLIQGFRKQPTLESAIKLFNENHAFMLSGGSHHILWETTDPSGRPIVQHLNEGSFHKKYAWLNVPIKSGKSEKSAKATDVWLNHADCRRYDGYAFRPGKECHPRFYNLWRGFSVRPVDDINDAPRPHKEALNNILDHIRTNVANNDDELFKWIINYFAHMVQFPWEKPRTALVLKGGKGTGKTSIPDWFGSLFRSHYLLAADSRYLTSNFNAHLTNLLLFALDEAMWAGDKSHEGILKNLITNDENVVEMKYKEAFTVPNLMRIVIIGNEDWLVPATYDERRFAVFNVSDRRQGDARFFGSIHEAIQDGASSVLLRYLLNWEVDTKAVHVAPVTDALLEQKEQTLTPFESFWFDSLRAREWMGCEYPDRRHNFTEFTLGELSTFLRNYCASRNINSRLPAHTALAKKVLAVAPHLDKTRLTDVEGDRQRVYVSRGIKVLRSDFARYMRQPIPWPDADEGDDDV